MFFIILAVMADQGFEIVSEIILSVIEYPGAFLHWLYLKKKVPIRTITEKHYYKNLLISLLLYAIIGYITYQIIR